MLHDPPNYYFVVWTIQVVPDLNNCAVKKTKDLNNCVMIPLNQEGEKLASG